MSGLDCSVMLPSYHKTPRRESLSTCFLVFLSRRVVDLTIVTLLCVDYVGWYAPSRLESSSIQVTYTAYVSCISPLFRPDLGWGGL